MILTAGWFGAFGKQPFHLKPFTAEAPPHTPPPPRLGECAADMQPASCVKGKTHHLLQICHDGGPHDVLWSDEDVVLAVIDLVGPDIAKADKLLRISPVHGLHDSPHAWQWERQALRYSTSAWTSCANWAFKTYCNKNRTCPRSRNPSKLTRHGCACMRHLALSKTIPALGMGDMTCNICLKSFAIPSVVIQDICNTGVHQQKCGMARQSKNPNTSKFVSQQHLRHQDGLLGGPKKGFCRMAESTLEIIRQKFDHNSTNPACNPSDLRTMRFDFQTFGKARRQVLQRLTVLRRQGSHGTYCLALDVQWCISDHMGNRLTTTRPVRSSGSPCHAAEQLQLTLTAHAKAWSWSEQGIQQDMGSEVKACSTPGIPLVPWPAAQKPSRAAHPGPGPLPSPAPSPAACRPERHPSQGWAQEWLPCIWSVVSMLLLALGCNIWGMVKACCRWCRHHCAGPDKLAFGSADMLGIHLFKLSLTLSSFEYICKWALELGDPHGLSNEYASASATALATRNKQEDYRACSSAFG